MLYDLSGPDGLPVVLRESDANGVELADYVYAGASLLSQERSSTGIGFVLADGQGSTRLLADASGALTDSFTDDAFGSLIGRSGTTPTSMLYGGQQFDPSTGLYNLRARSYSPSQGRLLGRDPLSGDVFDPTSLHPYTYAKNDPLDNADPSGRQTLGEVSMAAAVSGILVGLGTTAISYTITRDLKASLIAGTVAGTAVFTFVFLAAGGVPLLLGAGGVAGTGAGVGAGAGAGAGVGITAAEEAATVATASEEAGAVTDFINFAMNLLLTGRGAQLTALLTAMLSTPQGRALIRTAHVVSCASVNMVGPDIGITATNALVSLCNITRSFVVDD